MNLNLVKHITTFFLFFVFFQKVTLCQNILTQSTFSSTFNDEKIGLDNFTYRLNFLLSNTTNSSNNKIFPGILQTEEFVEMPLFIPNGFSPNEDNLNDSWVIDVMDKTQNYKVTVFNKWGGILYAEEYPNIINWDGMFNGSLVPRSDYYFVFVSGNQTYSGALTVNY